jgi:hypothetical protein
MGYRDLTNGVCRFGWQTTEVEVRCGRDLIRSACRFSPDQTVYCESEGASTKGSACGSHLATLQPPHIVLVHGEPTEMGRLASDLRKTYSDWEEQPKVYTPKNCEVCCLQCCNICYRNVTIDVVLQELVLEFKAEKTAKAIGSLARISQQDGREVSGVLVSHGFDNHLLAPEDIPTYTQLSTSTVSQTQHVPFHQVRARGFSSACHYSSSIGFRGARVKACFHL